MSFYAVKSGKTPGIYASWKECESQVKGFPKAIFKKFSSKSMAEEFISNGKVKPDASISSISTEVSQPPKAKKRRHDEMNGGNSVKSCAPLAITFMHDISCLSRVIVYTDGSCKSTPEGSRAGIGVYWGDNHPWNVSSRVRGVQGNNRAEIAAACIAISRAKTAGLPALTLCTDSKFTINCATDWGHKWRQNNWILSTGEPVQVRAIVEKLMDLLDDQSFKVEWCHVPGHRGIPGNEAADRLANDGADLPNLDS